MFIAEIISVGTELLLGEITDTNAVFLANELKARGVVLHHKNTVGDNLQRIADTIKKALERADLVILGGGLGPTDDDLTREGIALVLGETPEVDQQLLAHLEGMYSARGRTMPQSNIKQAWLIPSATPLDNPLGTAPGWMVKKDGKVIVAMPGPPQEMKPMWKEQVLPRLDLPERALYHVTLHTSGIGESNISDLLGDLTLQHSPSVATYARKHGVDVRVAHMADSLEEARTGAAATEATVREKLGKYIYGEDSDTLESVTLKKLQERKETLAVFEAFTAGALAQKLGRHPRLKGVLSTADHGIQVDLGLTPRTLTEEGEDSVNAAIELARGIQDRLGATYGLATVGNLDTHTCHVALVTDTDVKTATLDWVGTPDQLIERTSNAALMLLYRTLKGEA
ncbi:CinA family nicotinamide mononucleotide deamidase-related protein [Deinococcus roseus]|uniref:CinA-like protein n=1 Tax=Deinococcus roseus TaxID=392414 RepID=A0ABQ2CVM4_9DEIO|nr:CinA family nicotinamide mononucleotide deamidase-related protein [Deinococcus roseus]GGJ25437.1 CinA-like protein [Deinococcus roseus]